MSMTHPAWQVSGEYFETCSCDYVCPCILTNMSARPTKGPCTFAMAYQIERGRFGGVTLDGLGFAVVGSTPGVMGEGNWKVGLVIDERATADQEQAIAGIASGQAGGPMAALGPLVTTFLGAEKKAIRFERTGLRRAVTIPGVLEQAVEGVASTAKPGEAMAVDNTMHPANARLALAHALRSRLNVFGLSWEDTSGRNNGHFAPFAWQAAAAQ
jgi:hypothetical protein